MQIQVLHRCLFAFVVSIAILGFSSAAGADPPSRIARLGYVDGAVSFAAAGENDWDEATLNRPLTRGDRLWTDAGGRAEIQVGGAMVRMNAGTGVSILNLDDRVTQLQLTEGTLNVRVRRLGAGRVFEVDTPNLAFTLRQSGDYRISVDPEGRATTIVVRKGQGEAYGENAAYVIDSRQAYRFTGTGLRDYRHIDAPRRDEFDRWAAARDRRHDASRAARYVSQDVVGYQDLDANGNWRADPTYGNVWFPSHVASGWAPYRDGHWAWVDPWGWTWIDDAPWGFAVSHYGRWTNLRGSWGWVPGPLSAQAYYAPALVVFIGGTDFQVAAGGGNVSGVAWFPLAPREVYRPAYPVSRGYFENINRSNTVINNTVISNTYNISNVTNVTYANRQVPGAVVVVPKTAFAQSQPVARVAVPGSRELTVSAPVAVVPLAAPGAKGGRGPAARGAKPPPRVFERPVVARTAAPVAVVGLAAQRPQTTATPGKALDAAAREEAKPVAATAAGKFVTSTQIAPTMRPPPVAPAATPGKPLGKSGERNARAAAVTPGAPPPGAAAAQGIPPLPAVQAPDQRGKSELRGKAEPRAQPVAPPPSPVQRVPPVPVAAAPVASPPPMAQGPDQRGKSEQRGNGEQRAQPVAPPQRAAEPKAAPPLVATPGPAPQALRQRSAPPQAPAPAPVAAPAAAPKQAAQPAKPEPGPGAKQGDPRPPAASSPPAAQAAPGADPQGREREPAAGRAKHRKNDPDEQDGDKGKAERKE